MKFIIITAVESFHQDVLKLLKEAKIDSFSGTPIDGYNNTETSSFGWFPGAKEGINSHMFFAFTTMIQAENLMQIVKDFNQCKTKNKDFCIKVAVMPVEKYI